MILKLLLVIAVIYIVYIMFFKQKNIKKTSQKQKEPLNANDMVECQGCGIYVELDEAILSNAKYYCSKECVNKGK